MESLTAGGGKGCWLRLLGSRFQGVRRYLKSPFTRSRPAPPARQVCQALKESGVDFNAVDYYVDPIPKPKLKELLKKMKISATELLRTKEPVYTDQGDSVDQCDHLFHLT